MKTLAILGAVVMGLLLSACGAGPASPKVAPTPPSSPTSPLSQLPMVGCTTTYGVQPGGPSKPTLSPSSSYGAGGFPSSLASDLSVYQMGSDISSNGNLGLAVLGLSGLQCSAIDGGDGGQTITATAKGNPLEGVEMAEGNGEGPSISEACPFFGQELQSSGECFGGPILGEQITRLSSTVVKFVDPAGIKGNGALSGGTYPDDGISVWIPSPTGSSTFGYGVQVDCSLPAAEHNICTAVLNYASYWYGNPAG